MKRQQKTLIYASGRLWRRAARGIYEEVEPIEGLVPVAVGDTMVENPSMPGFYFRTDRSVVEVACPVPSCASPVGIPCHFTDYGCGTHYKRRDLARARRRTERVRRRNRQAEA